MERRREQKGKRKRESSDPVVRARSARGFVREPTDDAAGSWTASRVARDEHAPYAALLRSPRSSLPPFFPTPFSTSSLSFLSSLSVSLSRSAATRRAPFEAREINVRLVARRFSGSSATNHRRTDGRRRRRRRVRRQEENEKSSGSSRLAREGTRARILLRECATLLSALFVILVSRAPRL